MAVSLAVSEILSVKEWFDLEIWVWGRSRSLKMAPFDRPYDFLLVRHCHYSSLLFLALNNIATERSLKFIETNVIRKLGCGLTFLFAFYSNHGAILNRLWDIASHWSKVAKFLYLYLAPRKVGISRRCLILIKLEWLGYRMVKKQWQYVKPFP